MSVVREFGADGKNGYDFTLRETVTSEIIDDVARHAAAVDHALTKTALSQKSKDLCRAYVLDAEPLKCVAKRFGVSENIVAQTKTRVNKMIAAMEEGMS